MANLQPLIGLEGTKIKVSSVLNRDARQFGKRFMFDDSDETCWNSDQGLPQYVRIDLGCLAVVREIRIQFQGGFAGKECELRAGGGGGGGGGEMKEEQLVLQFYPADSNSLQSFSVTDSEVSAQVYTVVFKTSTDFFGRITVYSLQLYGFWSKKDTFRT